MSRLQDLVGHTIIALVPIFHPVQFQLLKLHEVEASGLWVESQKTTNLMLQKLGYASSSKTMIFFLPFQQIAFVIGSVDEISLDEKAFGV